MPKHLLECEDVSAIHHEVAGEGVAQYMGELTRQQFDTRFLHSHSERADGTLEDAACRISTGVRTYQDCRVAAGDRGTRISASTKQCRGDNRERPEVSDIGKDKTAWLKMEDLLIDERFALPALERMNRQDAVDFALASVGLEGMTPSSDVLKKARRFVNGEIVLMS